MLTLKKPFTKSSPETPAAAEASVKGKQLLHGRTKARVESLTAELNAARQALTQAEQAVGEQLVEGLDATASTDAMKQAADQVRILESALVVATQKDEAAHTALKEAQSQIAIQAEVNAVAQVKTVSLKVDQMLVDLERLIVDQLSPAMNMARGILATSGIRDGELNFLPKLPSVFKQLLLLSTHTLTGEGFVPVNMRAYEKLSDVVPDESFIRSRERPGQGAATPIPGWKIGD